MTKSRSVSIGLVLALLLVALPGRGQGPQPDAAGGKVEQSDLAEIGAKLSNPVSDMWALFTEFDVEFFDGDHRSDRLQRPDSQGVQ